MSLTTRKKRPLVRDTQTFRDARLFIIACDDTYAPKQYFEFFKIPRIHVHVVETPDHTCSAAHVLDRLLGYKHEPDDERWLVLDTDHYTQGTHLPTFLETLKRATDNGVRVALSKHCFDLWLLLHHVEETTVADLANCGETDARLRKAIGQYNKTNLNPKHFPLAKVCDACERAQRLDAVVAGGDIPAANTTRVYQIWRAIHKKALPTQLPAELQGLARIFPQVP